MINKPTPEEVKVFEEYWYPKICDKKGVNKKKLIKVLYEVFQNIEVEQLYDDTVFIKSCGSLNKNSKTKFEIFTANQNKYFALWDNVRNQLTLDKRKPLPQNLHLIVVEGIKKLLQEDTTSAIIKSNV